MIKFDESKTLDETIIKTKHYYEQYKYIIEYPKGWKDMKKEKMFKEKRNLNLLHT